jgi:HEAT repeat protein
MRESLAIRLRALTGPLLPRVLGLLAGTPLRAVAQQLGALALDRVAARFPVMAELIGLRGPAQTPERAPHAEAAAPAVTPLPNVEARLASLSQDPSWAARVHAVQQLAGNATPAVITALLRALRDPSVEVAAAAIDALARSRDARVVPALRGVLANTDGYCGSVTRAAAVQRLAALLDRSELEPVLDAIGDVDASVSIAAIAGLAEHAPSMLEDQLVPLLADRTGYYLPVVRVSAARALVRRAALSPARAAELLQTEPDPDVRAVLEAALRSSASA